MKVTKIENHWSFGLLIAICLFGRFAYAEVPFTNLVSFDAWNDGMEPMAAPVQGTNGNFYGTTYYGAGFYGSAFEMTPDGTVTTLVGFVSDNGAEPQAKLVQGKDGKFYGTTYYGGTNGTDVGGYGTVFSLAPDGAFETLVCFDGTNGSRPHGALVQGDDGSFYGTTQSGGANDDGTLFRVSADGDLVVLVSFANTNGAGPRGGLALDNQGRLYGTCRLKVSAISTQQIIVQFGKIGLDLAQFKWRELLGNPAN